MESTTVSQRKLAKILNDLGFDVIEEYQIGKWTVDCFVPSLNIAFEFDGPVHGLRKKKDVERDIYLTELFGLRAVVRLKEKDIANHKDAEERILSEIDRSFGLVDEGSGLAGEGT